MIMIGVGKSPFQLIEWTSVWHSFDGWLTSTSFDPWFSDEFVLCSRSTWYVKGKLKSVDSCYIKGSSTLFRCVGSFSVKDTPTLCPLSTVRVEETRVTDIFLWVTEWRTLSPTVPPSFSVEKGVYRQNLTFSGCRGPWQFRPTEGKFKGCRRR